MRFRIPLIRDLLECLLFHNDPELPKGKAKINPTRNWKKYKSIHLQECASYLVIDDPWFPHRHVDYSSRFRRKSYFSKLRQSQLWKVSEHTSGPWSPIAPAGPSSPRAPCNQRLSFKNLYLVVQMSGNFFNILNPKSYICAAMVLLTFIPEPPGNPRDPTGPADPYVRWRDKISTYVSSWLQLRLIYPPQHKTQKYCFKKETWSWYDFEHRFVYETTVWNKRNRPNTQRTHF